ncbi:helix-turn-helix domain-containing protein [Paraburkholderia dilworthii]|uniref:helix-turn-helix domain-containing protein n=1 Tax=Paraburkholderia dilworthii TaxID=948106 RepID=UPI0038BD14F6
MSHQSSWLPQRPCAGLWDGGGCALLLQHLGHITETAHALGISRKGLREKMRKHAIAVEPLH